MNEALPQASLFSSEPPPIIHTSSLVRENVRSFKLPFISSRVLLGLKTFRKSGFVESNAAVDATPVPGATANGGQLFHQSDAMNVEN